MGHVNSELRSSQLHLPPPPHTERKDNKQGSSSSLMSVSIVHTELTRAAVADGVQDRLVTGWV